MAKYLYAVTTISIAEIEAIIGSKVNALTEGYIDTQKGTIEGVILDIDGVLSPGQEAQLKHYLSQATRETLTQLPGS